LYFSRGIPLRPKLSIVVGRKHGGVALLQTAQKEAIAKLIRDNAELRERVSNLTLEICALREIAEDRHRKANSKPQLAQNV
jgi:hypothetical protein